MIHTQTSSYELETCLMMTHIHTPISTFVCVAKHISLSCLQERFSCTHAALHATGVLIHQCATSLLSRDSRIADCTVRHPGVERPFFWFLMPIFVSVEKILADFHGFLLNKIEQINTD